MNPLPTLESSTPHVASRDEWLTARLALLQQEKAFSRRRDELTRARQQLPWVRIDKTYTFHGPAGSLTLADLFAGRSQLIVYHFMFGADWDEGCKGCSYVSDHVDGMLPHLHARDVNFVAVSRAPYALFAPFQQRMGWKFPWVSSQGSDFNHDFHVSFDPAEVEAGTTYYNYAQRPFPMEEAPGLSVFARDAAGTCYHTYSTYGRGLDALIGTYQYLDLVPKARNETDPERPMSWVRHHDRY